MKKKKILFLILLGIISCNNSNVLAMKEEIYINYNGIVIQKEEYQRLQNLGFNEKEIKHMTNDEFENNKKLDGEVVSTDVVYSQTINGQEQIISKDEYEKTPVSLFGMQAGYIETGAKKMTTRIISVNGKYRYKVDLEWKYVPKVRSYDIIGIGIESNVKIASDIYFQQNYCHSETNCSSSIVSTKKSTQTGGAASFKIPSSDIITLSSYLYFEVEKNSSLTISELNSYGDYSHATKSITESNAQKYSIKLDGIFLEDAISDHYDAIKCATAVWTGSW